MWLVAAGRRSPTERVRQGETLAERRARVQKTLAFLSEQSIGVVGA